MQGDFARKIRGKANAALPACRERLQSVGMSSAYLQLKSAMRSVSVIESIGAVLGYDERTVMPSTAAPIRAEQSSFIAELAHQRFTDPRIGEWLGIAETETPREPADGDEQANLREWRRAYDRAVKLPGEFVAELAKTTSLAEHAWAEARKQSSFAMFQPWLEKIVNLKRREASYVGSASGNPYDALLDTYEPGETSANVERVFASLRPRLVELLGRIVASPKKAPVELLSRRFPIGRQQEFARDASRAIGFDLAAGRIDVSVHPFCSGIAPGDTRMTSRYHEQHFNDGFFGVLHETGHALYEQGLPKEERFGEPLAEAVSLGIHESQSRMWENLVGRSEPFWRFMFPKARTAFPETLRDVALEPWLFAINDVRPSLIRVEADELTYNLHIMLRFELEQAMIKGEIAPRDVVGEWNARFKSYLGLDVPDDARGCLQDVHWSAGLIGYFPTYALGNLYAAQFFEQARTELGDLDGSFARGEFAPLLGWLREKIHVHGRRYRAGELVQRVTGRPLDAEPLLRHLTRKAGTYYGV